MTIWQAVSQHISTATGQPFTVSTGRAVGGGCINSTYLIGAGSQRYFLKTNRAACLTLFEAEAEGLRELAAAGVIRVPAPVCAGLAGDSAFLVLEYIDFGAAARGGEVLLARQLAQMHRKTSARYGWHRDNAIGSTPQSNTASTRWPDFWREHRLGFQLDLAARNGCGKTLQRQGERLLGRLDGFFGSSAPAPSLLHGDLWGGNYGFDEAGMPVIFDPAVYYGDRETDLAMTELFGGFPATFLDAYREAYPLDEGYRVRKTLYNLYHILNHFNLFGGGYLGQAGRMIATLLGEAG